MNTMVKLTNETGVAKRLAHLGLCVDPGASVCLSVEKAKAFMTRPGWRVSDIPREVCKFREDGRLALLFVAPICVADGYGNHAEEIMLGLDSAGVDVTARHLWQLNPAGLSRRSLKLLQRPIEAFHAVGLCMATPGEFGRLPTLFRVGLTQYESTDYRPAHPEWTRQINEMDLLLTFGEGEEWNVPMFRRCGVRAPIRTVRGSGNWHFYRPENRWRFREQDEFVVVTWGAMHQRKAGLETVEVFKRAFPQRRYPRCRLRVKTIGGLMGNLPPGSFQTEDPRIEVISADWLPEQMLEFAQSGDVMLYLSRGEGCGRPPREAMAMGLPLICANNTGMQPICDSRFMTPIETKAWAPATIGGEWAEPNWDHAVGALRWHYENRDEANRKAAAGAEWMGYHHSPEVQASDIVSVLYQIDPGLAKGVDGRDWREAYMPKTDHGPALTALNGVGGHREALGVIGPREVAHFLKAAGYRAQTVGEVRGSCEEIVSRLRDALQEKRIVVLVAASKCHPVKRYEDELAMEFHGWARLLEREKFNVVGRVAYGGEYNQDYGAFVISDQPRRRGTMVRYGDPDKCDAGGRELSGHRGGEQL